jgi:hypothetical protein
MVISRLFWICSFVIFCTIYHHSFHFGFMSTNVWFYTLSRALSNNNSPKSFNPLSICKVWEVLLGDICIISISPFSFWSWTRSSWVWFFNYMLIVVDCSCCWLQVCSKVTKKKLLFHTNNIHLPIIFHQPLIIIMQGLKVIMSWKLYKEEVLSYTCT